MAYEKQKEAIQNYFKTEKGKRALRRSGKVYNLRQRARLFDILGGQKCIKCEYDDFRALQIDHKSGNGLEDIRRIGGGGVNLVQYYMKHKDEAREKLQVLCANCNWIKRYEESEYFKPNKSN